MSARMRRHRIVQPFEEAREVLRLAPDHDRRALKLAYRTLVQDHPPDRDPDGFRRVRAAYERLDDPYPLATERLHALHPWVDAPLPDRAQIPDLAVLALQVLAASIETRLLLPREESDER